MLSRKTTQATLTKYTPHTCSLITYMNFKTSNSARYLAGHHDGNITLNRPQEIVPAETKSWADEDQGPAKKPDHETNSIASVSSPLFNIQP
jgi:hypothetical protein